MAKTPAKSDNATSSDKSRNSTSQTADASTAQSEVKSEGKTPTNDSVASKPLNETDSNRNRSTRSTASAKERSNMETDAVKAINDGSANVVTDTTEDAHRDARIENPDDPPKHIIKESGVGKVALPKGVYEEKGRLYNSRGSDVTTDANTRLSLTNS